MQFSGEELYGKVGRPGSTWYTQGPHTVAMGMGGERFTVVSWVAVLLVKTSVLGGWCAFFFFFRDAGTIDCIIKLVACH